MNDANAHSSPIDAPSPEKQPVVLRDLLSVVNASRRQSSLYGVDHPNAMHAAEDLSAAVDAFIAEFNRTTFVFTRSSVIANDHNFVASNDSVELFERLRARGVMAVSLVGSVGVEQCAGFLSFLNAEPAEVRAEGGASAYLRKHAVSRIVATDALYTSDADCVDGQPVQSSRLTVDGMDHAVGAAIDWLSRQGNEDDRETPQLPIVEILSQPDQAARLIREAVTKLHASRRQETAGELASEVVHDLKDLAAAEKEKWDESTPQIRKAISKLPKGLRPEVSGFNEGDGMDTESGRSASISDVEAKVAEMLGGVRRVDPLPGPSAFGSLFGAKAHGLLSSWKRALQPESVMESSGRTIETLMIWEERATEHERIARALAGLVARAIAMKDTASALTIVTSLIGEMQRQEPTSWRTSNVRAALCALDTAALREVVESAIRAGDPGARAVATVLVEMLPDLALDAVGLLGFCGDEAFTDALRRGIGAAGAGATGPLAKLLREGNGGAREVALEMLIGMKGAGAIHEIAQALSGAEPAFVIRALSLLTTVRVPQVTEICMGYLSHPSAEVRCAALGALGELGDPTATAAIAQVATRHAKQDDTAEKIQAIGALAKIDCPEAINCLHKLANHRPLFGRNQYEFVRAAAEKALCETNARRGGRGERAA